MKMSINELKNKMLEQFEIGEYDEQVLRILSKEIMQLLCDQLKKMKIEDLFPSSITLQAHDEAIVTNIDNEYINLAIECCNMLKNDDEQVDKIDFVLEFIIKFGELKSKMMIKIKEFVKYFKIYRLNCSKFSKYEKERIENILFEGLPPFNLSKSQIMIDYEFSQNEVIVFKPVDVAFLESIITKYS